MADETKARSGWKTTEFWLTLFAVVMGGVAASGLIPAGGPWAKVVGLLVSVLGALGYGAQRASVKRTMALVPLLVLSSLTLSACATFSVAQQLARAHVALQAVDQKAIQAIGERCVAEAKACGKMVKPAQCPGWKACDANLARYQASANVIDGELAVCNRLLSEAGVK